jgi:hypothetical protein
MNSAREFIEELERNGRPLTLDEVRNIADEVADASLPSNPVQFAQDVLAISEALDDHEFTDDPAAIDLRSGLVLRALLEADRLPVEDTVTLLLAGSSDGSEALAAAAVDPSKSGTAFSMARLWLRTALRMIEVSTTEPPLPHSNIQPPVGRIRRSGVGPSTISDPEERAAYERALEKEAEKAERHGEWHILREMTPEFFDAAKDYLHVVLSADQKTMPAVRSFLEDQHPEAATIQGALDSLGRTERA